MIGIVVAREIVFGEQVANFDFNELEKLGIVDHVAPCS